MIGTHDYMIHLGVVWQEVRPTVNSKNLSWLTDQFQTERASEGG